MVRELVRVLLVMCFLGIFGIQGYAASPGVYFVAPQAKAKVQSPVQVKFGVKGMTVKPAGELVSGTGHHHLIIDGVPVGKGEVVAADATHIHFGKGQTETTIDLAKGKHKLTLQFADGAHRSYGPEMSATIEIDVR